MSIKEDIVDTVITVQEAASIAKCSVNHIKRLIAMGRLKAQDIGTSGRRYYRIRREDLEEMLRAPETA